MNLRLFLFPLTLAVSFAHATAPDCADIAGWNTGRHGKPADAACTADAYVEAFRLGEALAGLTTRRTALDTRIDQSPEEAGTLRRQQRQIDVDIEAIHGVATLRGWPTNQSEGDTP